LRGKGGVASGFKHVEPDAYIAKLLHVRKTKKHGMRTRQVAAAAALPPRARRRGARVPFCRAVSVAPAPAPALEGSTA